MVDTVSLLGIFAAGILAGGSPCALPLLPGFIGYLSSRGEGLGSREKSLVGILIILGVLGGMLALAALAAIIRTSLGNLLVIATPLVAALLVFFGALLIANHNPFYRIPTLNIPRMKSNLAEALAYGGLYGIIALPCSATVIIPVTLAISISSSPVGTLGVFLLFLLFGLGLGLPVIVVSLLSRAQGDWLVRQFARRARTMNVLAGVLLIGVAIYDLVIVYPFLRIYLPS